MDTSDLYEGGRSSGSKRKRAFDDYSSGDDDEHSSKSADPNAYNSSLAKLRTNLIRSELSKRRVASVHSSLNDSFDQNNRQQQQMTAEEKQLAENTKLTEPFNKKIPSLTLKSRESWFEKICRIFTENSKLLDGNEIDDTRLNTITDLCVKFEFEIVQKSKNLSVYQANCVRKYTGINKFTKEKKSYLKDYLANLKLEEDLKQKEEQNKQEENDTETINHKILIKSQDDEKDEDEKNLNALNELKISGFTSAKCLLKNETISEQSKEKSSDSFKSVAKVETKIEKTTQSNEISLEKCLSLQDISKLVVIELTKYYKAGKFLNKV
jgi:hypothetical protein